MALLLASTILVSVGVAAPPQPPAPPTIPNVYVDPAAKIDPTLTPGQTFTVAIMVTEVEDVFGWGFFLQYRSSIVTAQSVEPGDFVDWSWFFQQRIFPTSGYCTAAAYYDHEDPVGISGSGTLAFVTFLVNSVGTSSLDLVNTKLNTLISDTNVPIEHTASGGLFDNRLANVPPAASFFATPLIGAEGDVVTFDATASSDDGWIVDYQWNFGDDSTGSGNVITHTYPNVGVYVVTLTVTDNNGATGSMQYTLEILPWMSGGYYPDLVGGVAWPEASVNPNEDKSFNEKQLGDHLTLWAKVGNPVDQTFFVRVDFDIYSVDGTYLGKVSSDVVTIDPYETKNVPAYFYLADSRWRNYPYWRQKYHAIAHAYHSTGGEMEKGRFPAAMWFRINAEDHDRSIVSMTATSPVVKGQPATITVTIENQGWADETAVVSFAVDLSPIDSQVVTLAVHEQKTITFTWDTGSYNPDSYFIQVRVAPHPFERDTTDNVANGAIVVTA